MQNIPKSCFYESSPPFQKFVKERPTAPQGITTRLVVMREEKNWKFFSSLITTNRMKKGLPAPKKLGMTHI